MSAALSWEYTGARELCVEVFTSHSGNIGAKIMTKLTTALATSVALIAIASIADAKGNHRSNNNQKSATPHFVITGQPAGVKRVLSERKDKKEKEKKDKHAEKKHEKEKEKKEKKDGSAGKTQPVPPKQEAGKKPSPAAAVVTLSNGVTTSAIETGKGLTITSNSPGTITVSNGTNSVTMAGGSLTLHGGTPVSVPAGYQAVRLTNGDVSVAVSPVLASGPGQSRPVPPGVGAGDTLKDFGKLLGNTSATGAVSTVAIPTAVGIGAGAVVYGAATGDAKYIKDTINNLLVDQAGAAVKWATELF